MTLSPRAHLSFSVALTILVVAAAISLALQVPVTGLRLAADDQPGLVVVQAPAGQDALAAGDRVAAFMAGNTRVPVDAALLVEDPDALPTFAEYNDMMARQTRLAQALDEGTLAAVSADGTQVPVAAQQRHLADLPLMFWLQVLFGVGGMLTGALVAAGRPGDLPARLYALTGLGFLVFAPAAAVYSTRELLLSGELFRPLSLANHFGALLFTASLTALLWSYPLRLGRLPVVALCYLAAIAAWIADVLQLGDMNTLSPTTVLIIFAFSFVFAGMQWWATRGSPADRAALRWFLLSIYLATGLFAGVILIPTALGVPPPASQGVMFGAFLLMYWGLAFGIVRYRLFQLERWWRTIWWWFLGGVAVVFVDILLISTLALSDALALSLSVAIVGWLYFPMRQWLWSRASAPRTRTLSQWLPDVLPMIIGPVSGTSHEEKIRGRWPAIVAAVFRPLAVDTVEGSLDAPAILDNGLAMAVPDESGADSHLVLRHADGGGRLFTAEDLHALAGLRDLFGLALDRLRARDAGARIERERIRRDIHDDLGAKLLTLLHRSAPDQQALVREAINDLRVLVRALEFDTLPLPDALDDWQAEARKRCEAAGVTLAWQTTGNPAGHALNARQLANITRIVREAVSNALRHARPARIAIHADIAGNRLALTVHNDGSVRPLGEWPEGRGRQILRNRAEELGGSTAWQVDDGGASLRVEVPLA